MISARMKAKDLENGLNEQIEGVLIEKSVDFEEGEDPQSLSREQLLIRLSELLDKKGEIDIGASKTLENLKPLEAEYAKKVKDLEVIEERFN